MHEVTIQQVQPLRVAALSHQGEYNDIGNSFARLTAWAAGRNLIEPNSRSFGIY